MHVLFPIVDYLTGTLVVEHGKCTAVTVLHVEIIASIHCIYFRTHLFRVDGTCYWYFVISRHFTTSAMWRSTMAWLLHFSVAPTLRLRFSQTYVS